MARASIYRSIFLLIFIVFSSCQNKVIASLEGIPDSVSSFPITDVKLPDGPFKHATDLDFNSLLHCDPDRLLARFRIEARLEPKGEPYGGWEAECLAGYSLGHHLSTCALMYRTIYDERFKERANYNFDQLEEVQKGHGDGYFVEPDQLRNRLKDESTETCNVYNMIKLSRHLFLWESKTKVADYYKRALFNHILSSRHPETGRVIYNLSLEIGGHILYQDPGWFTCCVGTDLVSHCEYGANIYYHNDQEFNISRLQFIEKANGNISQLWGDEQE